MEPKVRKLREYDPVGRLFREYRRKIDAVHREIDDLAQRGENRKVATPNYVQEVIAPLAKIVKEKGIAVDEKIDRINARDAYYKVRIGEVTIGGFSYPGPQARHIDFTVFAHDRPWGRVFEIGNKTQLLKTITGLVEFLGLDDERQ